MAMATKFSCGDMYSVKIHDFNTDFVLYPLNFIDSGDGGVGAYERPFEFELFTQGIWLVLGVVDAGSWYVVLTNGSIVGLLEHDLFENIMSGRNGYGYTVKKIT